MEEKKDSPLISIITPSLNQGIFLERTIQSVLSQDYPNIEYIIIDGGSTDGSLEIIKRYASQLAYWVSRTDHGQAEAINEGFRKATGKYVAWLNSDDMYLPTCILKAVQTLDANPQAAMVFGQVEVIDAAGDHIGSFKPVTYSFEDLLTYKIIIPQQAVFFRRSLLEEIGLLDIHLHFALDHDLFLRIGKNHSIASIPSVMAQYRLSNSNKGVISRSKWSYEFLKILDKFYDSREDKSDFYMYKDAAYAMAYYRGACNMLDDERYTISRKWYILALKRRLSFLLNLRWLVNFMRTFLGKRGNFQFIKFKTWLGKLGILDISHDWWIGLQLSQSGNLEKFTH